MPFANAKRSLRHSPTSSLSWSETVVTTYPTPLASQLHHVLHNPVGVPPLLHSSGVGVDALEAMAMRCLLDHLELLERESLEQVPEILLHKIWRLVESSNLVTLHVWQIFTKACPVDLSRSTRKTITHHHIPLSLLSPHISASPLHYLISLTLISSISDTNASLSCLSTLPNLMSLHINGDSSSTENSSMISDDTIRLWNKKAKLDKEVFPCLRYLFLRFQFGVTERALAELEYFPRLEMVVTSRCGVKIREAKKIVREKGWKITKNAFFAHADTTLESSPRGRNYLDVMNSFIASSVSSTPLSLIQIGRQAPTLSTNVLLTTQEIECWVKDSEPSEAVKIEELRKRQQARDVEEAKQENGKKRRRIKEAKKRDLLALLEGM
ncbi:hypothetical protein M436DRAFT_36484 [Aureobasidium namibiae CBS 147.97]|uniref:Uncharacterized protein n=1 Tax=Aureobasidium namibiae CBS 147.97 TaxID=1043004 RepID=A0A074WVS7_9PEZI